MKIRGLDGVCLGHGLLDKLQWEGTAMSLVCHIYQKIPEHKIQWSNAGPALTGRRANTAPSEPGWPCPICHGPKGVGSCFGPVPHRQPVGREGSVCHLEVTGPSLVPLAGLGLAD